MNKIALRIGINHHWNHLYYQGLSYMDPRYPLPFWNIIKQDKNALRVLKGFYPLSKIEIHKTREVIDIYICRDRYVTYPLISRGLLVDHNQITRLSNPPIITNPITASPRLSIPLVRDYLGVVNREKESPNTKSFIVQRGSTKLSELSMHRALFNIFKTRIQIFNLYTFPIHEAELLVGYLLREGGKSETNLLPHKNKTRLNAFRRLWKMGVIKGIKIKIQGRYKKSTRTQNDVLQFGQIPNTPTTNLRIKLFYASRVLLQSLGTSSLHIYIVYAPHTGRAYKPQI